MRDPSPDIRKNSDYMTAKDLNVCLLPLEIKWGDKCENLESLKEALQRVHPETDLVVLPECFSTGFPAGMEKEEVRPLAEKNTGDTIDFLKGLARMHNVAIAGSYVANSGGSLYNRAFFIEPSGEEYFADKRHLFTMAKEHNVFSKGHDRLKVRYRGWEIAMVICYDIRFPVWCRNVDNDYDLLIAVANWPKVRAGAWNTLLQARAIENESFVCGVNCRGIDPLGYEYGGDSAVIDFKGKNISVTSQEFLYGSLSKEKLDKFREKFPAYRDADDFKIL